MNKVVNVLNNKWLVAIVVGLFVVGFGRRILGR